MNTSLVLRTPVLALSLVCTGAHAQSRCDCSTIVDTCAASATVVNDAISIESDHRQCSRVDYLVDGVPFVALVVDGSGRQSRGSASDQARVLMQSCQVCLDTSASAPLVTTSAATLDTAGTDEAPPLREREIARLIAVDPQYPAAASGTDGFVELSFAVTALGLVENASVTAAEPRGVFEQAALAAVARWRYSAEEGREPVTLTHRFDFKSKDAPSAEPAQSRATPETAIDALIARSTTHEDADADAAVSGPTSAVRNHCIREQVTYDFGEMVDANLMNTCSEPLLVYSCAEGMGRYHRRWVCQSAESAKSILVRPGDRLAGNVAMIEVPEGVRTFRYAEDFFVARPRNTAYWWLACEIEDAECRGSGRQWARSMDGKEATVDPQLWTQQSVATSF
jgi:TonB family protein